jgi:hypothetical protein
MVVLVAACAELDCTSQLRFFRPHAWQELPLHLAAPACLPHRSFGARSLAQFTLPNHVFLAHLLTRTRTQNSLNHSHTCRCVEVDVDVDLQAHLYTTTHNKPSRLHDSPAHSASAWHSPAAHRASPQTTRSRRALSVNSSPASHRTSPLIWHPKSASKRLMTRRLKNAR